jgi:hypothetical protein
VYTDKGGVHDFLNGYYNEEFTPRRNDKVNILEIGVLWGGSIKLWTEWFTQGSVYGIDIVLMEGLNIPNATLIQESGYTRECADNFPDEHFDYIIDDGPHSLQSQIDVIDLWISKLKIGGKLIIEDIQNMGFIPPLEETAKRHNATYKTIDLRNNVGRYDDIIFEVTR